MKARPDGTRKEIDPRLAAGLQAIMISSEAKRELERIRERSGHQALTATVEWLIRAQTALYARIDRANTRDVESESEQ